MRKKYKTTEDKEKEHAVTQESYEYQYEFVVCDRCPRCGQKCLVIKSVDTGFRDYLAANRSKGYDIPEAGL
jgi:succinate dehydrogenase/fumarate reductase-like Fe-S protein